MARKGSTDLEVLKSKCAKALIKKPLTAAEIAAKIKTGHSGRGLGRALGALVREGKAVRVATRVPGYHKVG